MEKKVITSSTPDADVLRWDAEGHDLIFVSDDLKALNDVVLAELRPESQQRYFEAKAVARAEKLS
jgi:hypothetical protein